MTYSDSYIDLMGTLYRADRWLQQACTFEQFLAHPESCRAAATRACTTECAGLLPAQREVQQRLDAARRQR